MSLSLRPRGWSPAERRTLGIGAVALTTTSAVVGLQVGRVWRRGSAPLPTQTDDVLLAAEEAVAETIEVAVAGYQDVSARQNAWFNMLTAFVTTFLCARGLTYVLRERPKLGPFRNMHLGHRHIHHFVPGIAIAFASGAASILTDDEDIEPALAIPFGIGMGLTLDESALLLELDDVYWTPEGLVSVQITLAVAALLGALSLAVRFLRRGEAIVLPDAPEGPDGLPARPAGDRANGDGNAP